MNIKYDFHFSVPWWSFLIPIAISIIFLVLRITKIIAWSCLWVFSPLWLSLCGIGLAFICWVIVATIIVIIKGGTSFEFWAD